MSRQRFCRSCGQWHSAEDFPSECRKPRSQARSELAVPYFICDTMDEVQSMADGKYYSSKQAIRASYRAENNPQGVDYIELGNEPMADFKRPERDRKADREAIERALNDVEYGNAPPVLTELPV